MLISTSSLIVQLSANIATALFGAVIILQLLITLGLLPISMAWGGRQAELTPKVRIASLVAAVILGVFAYIIRLRAGLVGAGEITLLIKILAWVVTAFMAFNTLTNLTSQSKAEKLIFTPITLILTIVCFVVSISKTTDTI
jgi:hypothetical protein